MPNAFQELAKLSPGTLAAVVAFAGACGAIISAVVTAIVGKFIVTPFLSARDRQDKETEWRKHAIELTKLAVDAKLKTRSPSETTHIRPPILDFLANYRDLQELGSKSPKELYQAINAGRISKPEEQTSIPASATRHPNPAKASEDISGANPPRTSFLSFFFAIMIITMFASCALLSNSIKNQATKDR